MSNTRFKDFGRGKGAGRPDEPLSFKLHGEIFHAKPRIQGQLLLELVEKSTDTENTSAQAGIISSFFKEVLKKESYERFQVLLHDDERIVEVEDMAEIVGWLMEEYTNRPEGQPEAS
jgi:hypothetical protein